MSVDVGNTSESHGVSTDAPHVSTSEQSSGRETIRSGYRMAVLALLCMGFAPLLIWHLYSLLERPHYQFAILIPIAAWLLTVAEAEQIETKGTWRNSWFFCSLLLISLAGLGAAIYLWSPWLAAVSFLLILPSLLWMLGGMARFNQWFRGWILCWMMIPLPFGLDQDLIIFLRSVTTRITSSVLDQFQILHLQYGNVIEVPGKQLFIADACSGIHSLYVLLAAALFVGLWLGRGIIHIFLLFVGAFFLVILENVLRLFLIAALLKYQVDFSSGIKHMLLGGALFVGSLLILVSMDQLISFFVSSKTSVAGVRRKWLEKKQDKSHRLASLELTQSTFLVFVASAVIASGMGLVQVYQSHGEVPDFAGLSLADIELPEFGLQAMPETISGYERVDYKIVERVLGDPFGQASQQWTYRNDAVTILLSVDYPYDGIHDLCVCYSQIGWTISEKKVLTENEVRALNPEEFAPIAVGKISRDLYGHGLLAFSLFDLQGNTSAVIKELIKRPVEQGFEGRFGERGQKQESQNPKLTPPFVQVQILVRCPEIVDAEQEQELLQFFIEARKQLTEMSLEKLKDN